MHRRLALACSLAFTTIVTFGIIAVGAQVGIFSAGHPEASAEVAAPAPTDVPPAPPTAAPPPQDPIVVTQYDYVDVPDPAPTKATVPTTAPKPSPTVPAAATTAPGRGGSAAADSQPTSAPPTAAPSEPEPEPTTVRREEPKREPEDHEEDD
ncbi:MAG: hypothetical protein EPO22_14620 [Dehalococcoidia bacterium]|nr:MAG: hypothetical protein EPO22_14620 [Dehalococcoidia bacterium]